jgi:hypothetical protein
MRVRRWAIQQAILLSLLLICSGKVSAIDIVFSLNGGGKFVTPDAEASIVRLTLTGTADLDATGNLTNFANMSGTLMAFNFLTYTEIESQSLSLVQCSVSEGTNFTANGQGVATVNGAPTNITFAASNVGGVINYAISDPVSGAIYMSGTGELNRAALQLSAGVTLFLTALPDGNMQITASGGIPGAPYSVQATTMLNSPSWATIGMATAGTNGMFLFTDLNATNFATRFYRALSPPP